MLSDFSLQRGRAANYTTCLGCLIDGQDEELVRGQPLSGFGSRWGRQALENRLKHFSQVGETLPSLLQLLSHFIPAKPVI